MKFPHWILSVGYWARLENDTYHMRTARLSQHTALSKRGSESS